MSPPNEVRNEDSGSETAELETHSRDRQKDTFWAEVGNLSAKLGPSLGHEPETSGRGSGDVSGTSRKHLGETGTSRTHLGESWATSRAQVVDI